MIVDAHVHILPDSVCADLDAVAAREPWFQACHQKQQPIASAESLLAAMDANGVDRAICFSWPFEDPELCREGNDYIAAVQHQNPDRIIGFATVQPASPQVVDEIERCVKLGLQGLGGLNADAQGWSLSGKEIDAVAVAAQHHNLPITLHCSEADDRQYPGKGTATPDLVLALAQRHPELRLIAAHLGGGMPLDADLSAAALACPQLRFDTSAMPFVYPPSAYRQAIDSCGLDRLFFGSDHPLLDLPRYRKGMEDANLSSSETSALLGDSVVNWGAFR